MSLPRLLVICLVPMGMIGCRGEREPGPRPAAAKPIPTVGRPDAGTPARDWATPSEAVRRVNELRRAGRLSELGRYVTAERRAAVIELIRAVDQLVLDNRVLQQRIRASGAKARAALFDRSGVANIIGVFSTDIEIITEDLAGDSAVVTIQVADRLPLDRVHLELRDDRWVIQPDPPIAGLAAELRNLGKALRRVAEAVEARDMSLDQIGREMEFWQKPALARIRKLIDDATRDRQDPQAGDA